jgi:hypothetical protein
MIHIPLEMQKTESKGCHEMCSLQQAHRNQRYVSKSGFPDYESVRGGEGNDDKRNDSTVSS